MLLNRIFKVNGVLKVRHALYLRKFFEAFASSHMIVFASAIYWILSSFVDKIFYALLVFNKVFEVCFVLAVVIP